MVSDDGAKIDGGQHVAVEDDGCGIDVFFGILESPAGAKRRAFDGISDPDAVIGPVFQEIFDFSRLIRQAEDDFVDAGASHKIDLIKQKWRICDGHDGFRGIDRKRPEACALPSGQNESLHIAVSILEYLP